jgi:ribosomal protein RSM22 (predicted rRNA methylase)
MPDFKPVTCLDYGAGLASGTWAAHHIFPSLERLALVEPNLSMRKLGKFLTTDQMEDKALLWVDSLAMIPSGDKGKFDLVVLGYVLQEIPSAKQRELVVDALW